MKADSPGHFICYEDRSRRSEYLALIMEVEGYEPRIYQTLEDGKAKEANSSLWYPEGM